MSNRHYAHEGFPSGEERLRSSKFFSTTLFHEF